jgi:hypothetical protein
MKLAKEGHGGSLRFSFGRFNPDADVQDAVENRAKGDQQAVAIVVTSDVGTVSMTVKRPIYHNRAQVAL